MKIILKSEILIITKILKKTKAQMFKDLKVGDKILLSIPVEPSGWHHGTYASYIKIENLKTHDITYKSFNQINELLNCFEFNI